MNYVYVRNIKNGREEFMRGFADTDFGLERQLKRRDLEVNENE